MIAIRSVVVVLGAALALGMVVGCDDDDGKQACEAYGQKCPAGSANIQTCSADRINSASNAGPVEDCIQTAADCNAANACLGTLK